MMHHLYLLDDHKKSFNYVYACLMETLKHNSIQAEQCCLITHNTGKAHIKQGEYLELLEFQKELEHKELKVELRKEMYE